MSEEQERKAKQGANRNAQGRDRDQAGRDASKTAGKNRDFDESGESKNQGHGHPREERGGRA